MPAARPGQRAAGAAPRPPRPAAQAVRAVADGSAVAAGDGCGDRGGSRRRWGDGGNRIGPQRGVSLLPVSFGVSILADSDLASAGGLAPSGLPLSPAAPSLSPASVLPVSGLLASGLPVSVLAVSLLGVSSFAASPLAGSSLPGSVLADSDFGRLFPAGLAPLAQLLLGRQFAAIGAALAGRLIRSLPIRGGAASPGRARRLALRPRRAGSTSAVGVRVWRPPSARPRAWQPPAPARGAACGQTGRVARAARRAWLRIFHPCPACPGCRHSGYRSPRWRPGRPASSEAISGLVV